MLKRAEEKCDENLLKRIRGYDLFASQAKYHSTCRASYMIQSKTWRSSNYHSIKEQSELEVAHKKAFDYIIQAIDDKIIDKKEVMNLKDLRELYVTELQNTEFSKNKLEKHRRLSKILSFVKLGGLSSNLVFSKQMELSSAIKSTYQLAKQDMNVEVASSLRETVLKSFDQADNIGWPPTSDQLTNGNVVPEELTKFLTFLIDANSNQQTIRSHRLVNSLAQDICRAVTKSAWKLPKHISLCVTLRHLFRSKELITLMNRFGHCENYSFALELETVIATAAEMQSKVLSQRIVTHPKGPSVFHSEFDNFDQLVNDLTGSGSVHTAHGRMLQDFTHDQKNSRNDFPLVEKKLRS